MTVIRLNKRTLKCVMSRPYSSALVLTKSLLASFGLAALGALILLAPYRHLLPLLSPLPSSSSSSPSSRSLPNAPLRPTNLEISAAGINVLTDLYCLPNGTFILLSPPKADAWDPIVGGGGGFLDMRGRSLLPRKQLSSVGLSSKFPESARDATPEVIEVVPWERRAEYGLGDEAVVRRFEGTSIFNNESGDEFLAHYYHYFMEAILVSLCP